MTEEPRKYFGENNWVQSLTIDRFEKIMNLQRDNQDGLVAKISLIIKTDSPAVDVGVDISVRQDLIFQDRVSFDGPDCLQRALTYRGDKIVEYDRTLFND